MASMLAAGAVVLLVLAWLAYSADRAQDIVNLPWTGVLVFGIILLVLAVGVASLSHANSGVPAV